jgi:hypothetical protein
MRKCFKKFLCEELKLIVLDKKKGGQLSVIPAQSAVQHKTEAFLTAEFEMSSGEPGSYDRPFISDFDWFINFIAKVA